MTRRRELLQAMGASAMLAAGLARAQAQERMRRVGWIIGGSPTTHPRNLEALRAGLKERGWVEGRNVVIESRWAEGKLERIPALARELVALRPDVIVTGANVVIAEVRKATSSIPIVMVGGGDPVEAGFVASLSRPGGNLTGLTSFYEATPIKMLELVAALVPRGARVAALLEPDTPMSRPRARSELERTAKALGLRVEVVEARTTQEILEAVAALAAKRPAALIFLPGQRQYALGERLVRSAEALKIPVLYPFEEMVEAGGLMSYAISVPDNYRRAAYYVDRILRGANPGELPIEQPTQLALAINLKTAKAQGIRIPQSILLRANRVIE